MAEQRVVHLRYYASHRAEETERDVEPYTLLAYQGRWYLIAYCRWRQAMRDFRLDRIRHLALRDEVFGIPPSFDLDDYLGPAFGMHRGGRTYAIHVRFSPYQNDTTVTSNPDAHDLSDETNGLLCVKALP